MGKRKNPFIALVLDALCDVPDLTWRAMFGGYGLYSQSIFFAIVWDKQLFFRVDRTTEKKYIRKGSQPFVFSDTQKVFSYYQVPEDVFSSRKLVAKWAAESVAVQRQRQDTERNRKNRREAGQPGGTGGGGTGTRGGGVQTIGDIPRRSGRRVISPRK